MQKSDVSPCNINLAASIRTPSTRISRMPETEKLLQREISERVKVEDKLGMVFEELKALKSNSNYQELTIEQMKNQSEQLKRNYEVEIEILKTTSQEKDDIIEELEQENANTLQDLEDIEKQQIQTQNDIDVLEKQIDQLNSNNDIMTNQYTEKQCLIENLLEELKNQTENLKKINDEKAKLEQQIEEKSGKFGQSEEDLRQKFSQIKRKGKLSKVFGLCLMMIFGLNLAIMLSE